MAAADRISDVASLPTPDHGTIWYVLQTLVHLVSGAAILGALIGVLPVLSALGALVWYALQIYETKTAQRWLQAHKKPKRRARRTTRARAKPATPRKRNSR